MLKESGEHGRGEPETEKRRGRIAFLVEGGSADLTILFT